MPKGYWIPHLDVSNPQGFQAYREMADAGHKRFGSKLLARGGRREVMEGKMRGRNVLRELDLLIIDDVGLGQVKKRDDEPTAAHTLFNLIDRRHTHASTAITSNIKLSAWGKYLGDATLAAAILDRLAMRALRIDIDGPSYRQRVARERASAGRALPAPDDPGDSHDEV